MTPIRSPGNDPLIRSVEVDVLSFALDPPFRAAIRTFPSVEIVLARVGTDAGLEGHGHAFAFGRDDAATLAGLTAALGARLEGRDARGVEANWRAMWDALVFLGQSGAGLAAMAAIDLALWDILGKASGQPLHRLLGGARTAIPVYGSGGSLALSTAELAAEVAGHAEAGHRAVKIKLGHGREGDRARLAAVRDAVGPHVRIIADANQQWTPKQAVASAAALADFDLWWLEEPVPAARIEDCAVVRAAVPMAIATGETNFGAAEFERMLALGAADILMPNLQRLGGITPWRKVAAAAELRGIPVASHVFPGINAHLMCAVPNGLTLEIVPWWPHPFEEPLRIEDGHAAPPEGPGLGLTPDRAMIARHRI
jgi:L-alanine-DL-glutamate epimerase-like enolase superfamily enzyme